MRGLILAFLASLMIFSAVLWYMPVPSRLLKNSGLQFLDKKQQLRTIVSRLRALKRLRGGTK
jgi:hypothetical protein